jgi:quercetin dioxygenase-like cupin family protein
MSKPVAQLQPYVRQGHEHQRLDWLGGMELAVILDSAATAGQLTVAEMRAQRGDASPVHVHGRDDEAFLLLEGAMTVWVGDQRVRLQPGGIGFLPREVPHAFRFDADQSRALILSTPAGQENFFRAAGWDMSRPAPEGWHVPLDVLEQAAQRNGVTIVGPPHTLDD